MSYNAGINAGVGDTGSSNTNVGDGAGSGTGAGIGATRLGHGAGQNSGSTLATLVGAFAGWTAQVARSVGVGYASLERAISERTTATGMYSGLLSRSHRSVFSGFQAGNSTTGDCNVAIGERAGEYVVDDDVLSIGCGAGPQYTPDLANCLEVTAWDVALNTLTIPNHGYAVGDSPVLYQDVGLTGFNGGSGWVVFDVIDGNTLQPAGDKYTFSSAAGVQLCPPLGDYSGSISLGTNVSPDRADQLATCVTSIRMKNESGVPVLLTISADGSVLVDGEKPACDCDCKVCKKSK